MKLPDRHAHGPLTTKHVRWRETKARIRRWAKRVIRRVAQTLAREDSK